MKFYEPQKLLNIFVNKKCPKPSISNKTFTESISIQIIVSTKKLSFNLINFVPFLSPVPVPEPIEQLGTRRFTSDILRSTFIDIACFG